MSRLKTISGWLNDDVVRAAVIAGFVLFALSYVCDAIMYYFGVAAAKTLLNDLAVAIAGAVLLGNFPFAKPQKPARCASQSPGPDRARGQPLHSRRLHAPRAGNVLARRRRAPPHPRYGHRSCRLRAVRSPADSGNSARAALFLVLAARVFQSLILSVLLFLCGDLLPSPHLQSHSIPSSRERMPAALSDWNPRNAALRRLRLAIISRGCLACCRFSLAC